VVGRVGEGWVDGWMGGLVGARNGWMGEGMGEGMGARGQYKFMKLMKYKKGKIL